MYPPAPPPPPPPPHWEDADPNFPPAPAPSAPPTDESLGAGNSVPGGQRSAALPPGVVVRGLPVPPASPVPWSSGLFDCFDDVGNCCLTCLCPCITFGRVAEIADGGATSCAWSGALYAAVLCLTGCSCLYSCLYRSKLRRQFFLQEAPFADCVVHCCCESCALCQEHRELAVRGFDMRRGWKGNLERVGRTVLTLPPAVEGGMTR